MLLLLNLFFAVFHYHYSVGLLGPRAFRYFAPYSRDMVHREKRFTNSTILTFEGIDYYLHCLSKLKIVHVLV